MATTGGSVPATTVPAGADPLFFAEEFTASRRRYVPVPVDITGISKLAAYKNYNFPFITGDPLFGKETDYPLLFKAASDAIFKMPTVSYDPSTRFEIMTYEVYKRETMKSGTGQSHLDRSKELFVDSLLQPGLLADLSLVQTAPFYPAISPGDMESSRAAFDRQAKSFDPADAQSHLDPGITTMLVNALTAMSPPNPATYFNLQIVTSLAKIVRTSLVKWESDSRSLSLATADTLKSNIAILDGDIDRLSSILASSDPRLKQLAAEFIKRVGTVRDTSSYQRGKSGTGLPVYLLDSSGNIDDMGQGKMIPTPFPVDVQIALKSLQATLINLNTLIQTPSAPMGLSSKGYISQEFYSYLRRIAGAPTSAPGVATPCRMVMFKDEDQLGASSSVFLDMDAFTNSIIPKTFGTPSDPEFASRQNLGSRPDLVANFGCVSRTEVAKVQSPITNPTGSTTVEDAYRRLKNITGDSPLLRYLAFVRFIYIFFDHIPSVQPVVSALLIPLVGMYAGIIKRGVPSNPRRGDPNDALVLAKDYNTKEKIEKDIVHYLAQEALFSPTSREDSAKAVLKMLKNHGRSRTAIKALTGNLDAIREVGFSASTTVLDDLLKLDIADGKQSLDLAIGIYKIAGIVEFNLPSVGSAHMILPAVLGISEDNVMSLVYDLTTRSFPSPGAYVDAVSAIEKKQQAYSNIADRRLAFTQPGLNGVLTVKADDPYVKIIPDSARAYVKFGDNALPWSWEELLYGAFVSHVIVEADLLKPIGQKTMVRPCLQMPTYSVVFPAVERDLVGGFVLSEEVDIEKEPEIFAAIFEFPADDYQINLPKGTLVGPLSKQAIASFPGVPDRSSLIAPGYSDFNILRRGSSKKLDASHGKITYRLVEATNITDTVTGVQAWAAQPLTMKSNPNAPVPLLTNRTKYVWTSLPQMVSDGTPSLKFPGAGGKTIFLPAIGDIMEFLSSFFDWKMQMYFLASLRKFLQGRTSLDSVVKKINDFFTGLDVSIEKSADDETAAAIYMKANVLASKVPYVTFRNVLFNIAGPTASGNLSELLKLPVIIGSSDLTVDVKQFYKTAEITPPRGPLTYDIDFDDYLNLLKARQSKITVLGEKKEEAAERVKEEDEAQRELDVARMIKSSATRLSDPYSILVNEVVTRAIYKGRGE